MARVFGKGLWFRLDMGFTEWRWGSGCRWVSGWVLLERPRNNVIAVEGFLGVLESRTKFQVLWRQHVTNFIGLGKTGVSRLYSYCVFFFPTPFHLRLSALSLDMSNESGNSDLRNLHINSLIRNHLYLKTTVLHTLMAFKTQPSVLLYNEDSRKDLKLET